MCDFTRYWRTWKINTDILSTYSFLYGKVELEKITSTIVGPNIINYQINYLDVKKVNES